MSNIQRPDPQNIATATNPVGRFMVAVGGMIELRNTGKILIIQRAPDQDWRGGEWETQYGRIDQFEDTLTGLSREILEETGLADIEIKDILTVWHMFRGSEKAENELIGITYWVRSANEDVQLSFEHTQYRWVEPEEALELIAEEGIRRDIRRFIEIRNTQS
jgi:8-oxo-dGTP diphosphatase